MIVRRKLKRAFLFVFLSALLIKIHCDYQALISVDKKHQSQSFLFFNSSIPSRLVNVNNIKDIVSNTEIIEVNRGTKDTDGLIKSGGTPTNVVKLNVLGDKNFLPNQNVEEENKSQVDSPIQPDPNENGGDARVHSFRRKMEEVLHQRMESVKAAGPTGQLEGEHRPQTTVEGKLETTLNSINATQNNNDNKKKITSKGIAIPVRRIPKVPVPRFVHPSLKMNDTEAAKRLELIKKQMNVAKKIKAAKKANSPHKVSHVVDPTEISLNSSEILRIRKEISAINDLQEIHNAQIFGPVLNNDTVIVIQVHNRLQNLKHLVESLTKVRGINSTLVIFSHDFWDEKRNAFVRSIASFRTLQIFFPYSIQLNPSRFPGRDPRDCQWNQKVPKSAHSKEVNDSCLNSKWADSYGHYREASFTQIKHHWWWKLTRIFDHIRALNNFTGQVLFLEEDHYLVPDILHVLRLLVKERDRAYKNHIIFGLGNYLRQTGTASNVVDRGDWIVNKSNLGFSFDRKAYNIIKKCQKDFCNYDDYNWDWTLAYMGKSCASNQFAMLSMKLSRVLHIGSCGTHVHRGNCNLEKEVNVAKARISTLQKFLFPGHLNIQKNFKGSNKLKKSNGGWGDWRDKQLCLAFVNGTDIEQTLEMLQFSDLPKGKSVSLTSVAAAVPA